MSLAEREIKCRNLCIGARNVKVVAFGKAVLGMVAALEGILLSDIIGGVASVPVGAVETAKKFYPHHLPSPYSRIRSVFGTPANRVTFGIRLSILRL